MFLDCSHELPARVPAWLTGVCVWDFDGDGQSEVFLSARGANRILKWTNEYVRELIVPVLADPERAGRGAIAADFDGDGRDELYLVNENAQADRLFDFRPEGWFDLFSTSPHEPVFGPYPTRSVAALDRRGHGRYSFAIASQGGPLRLLERPDMNSIVELAPALGIDLPMIGGALLVAPLASQRPDLFSANQSGTNRLFRNTGLGTFLEVALEHGLADPDESGIGATLFDAGDGTHGILVAVADGPHRLFARRDDAIFRNLVSPAMAFPSDTRTVVVADFDNDGFEEILFINRQDANRFFRRQPGEDCHWIVSDPGPVVSEAGGTGAAVGDFDQDGRLELVMTRGDSPPLLARWAENDSAWLRVRPLTRFGAAARGAFVRLVSGGRIQVRTICGGSGSLCQMEPVAHFGLGTQRAIESVQIVWPDGTLAKIEHPEACREIVVRYPGT